VQHAITKGDRREGQTRKPEGVGGRKEDRSSFLGGRARTLFSLEDKDGVGKSATFGVFKKKGVSMKKRKDKSFLGLKRKSREPGLQKPSYGRLGNGSPGLD